MAPAGGGKRKRGDRNYSGDNLNETSRPSPHRPDSLNLAQQNHGSPQNSPRDNQERGRGGRRGNRGGRGQQRSPQISPNSSRQSRSSHTAPPPGPNPVPSSSRPEDSAMDVEPQNATSAASASTQTLPPQPTSSIPYLYEHLTDEVLGTWNETGSSKMLETGLEIRKKGDLVGLGLFFQEIIRSAVDRRLEASLAGSLVEKVLGNDAAVESEFTNTDAASSFLDNVSVFTHEESDTPILKTLLSTSGIPLQKMREEFDLEFLVNLGLTRNTFERMRTRYQTNVLYRQSNYNLLREESEGYSKLVTELFTTSGNEPPNNSVILGTYQRVKAMIGAFDLDVGRVLDITLDVFAAVLVRHYRFFLKYLRTSTWWPEQAHIDQFRTSELSFRTLPKWALPQYNGFETRSPEESIALAEARDQRDTQFWDRVRAVGISAFFELGGRRVDQSEVGRTIGGKGLEADELRKWTELTGITPPSGNKVAAQVLGFKLRFYSSSARSATDILPLNLVYLAALLIKVGFISLKDLYAHLWPEDSSMEAVKEQKMQEKLEREKLSRPGGGAMNALMTAGALPDDTVTTSSSRTKEPEVGRGSTAKADVKDDATPAADAAEPQEDLPEPLDQKVQLFKSLLCIGALPEALYMLGRFPWLPDAFPELPEYIHRILHHCLSKVYEPLHPLSKETNLREPHKIVDPDQSGVAKGTIRRIDQSAPKVLRWAQLDRVAENEGIDYRFYWDDWTDNIPICQTVDDVFTLCGSFLNYSGVKIGQDTSLLSKLARIGTNSCATDRSSENHARWIDLCKRLLVPALSLTKANSGVVNEVWELMKQFTVSTRYSIYAEWYTGQISRLPDIKSAFDQSKAETKDVLKRISKTNLKPMARALSKVSTSSPGIVFSVAIGQIESYENLVEVVVECARYFTYLGYDVLTWSLMNSLGAKGRNRVQADGMLTSRWLAALSLFSGKVFKRYGVMNPTPILQYVNDQLQKGNPTDLIVLEEIISSMAGIVSDTNFNDAQVTAMGGGRLLQAQTMLQLLDRRHETSMKATAKRLMRSLIEPKLVGPLLISIAQERQTQVYKIPESDAHLKLLGNLFDEIHRVLTQYLDLLRSNLSIKEFNQHVPSVTELIGDFGLEPAVAFWISRPSIAAEMAEYDKKTTQEKKESTAPVAVEEVKAKESDDPKLVVSETGIMNQKPSEENAQAQSIVTSDEPRDTEMKDSSSPNEEQSLTKPVGEDTPWHPVLQAVMESTRDLIPDNTWAVLSDSFYFTFWQMSLEDMFVPMPSYEEESNRLKKKLVAVNSDRSDMSSRGMQKKDDEKKAIADLQSQLQAEMGIRIGVYQRTKQRLNKEKELWFADGAGRGAALNIAIIEHCFIPRIMLSPIDAMYTFKFFKYLHSSGTKNFRTVTLLDELFNGKRLAALFFLCTAQEAENVGRFYNELIKDLARWHGDKAVFEKEAHGVKKDLPGFRVKLAGEEAPGLMDYEDFRRYLGKWHMQLNVALKTCFQSGEYMHIRNAIVVLKALALHYPVINWMGGQQVTMVSELSKTEKRGDLKLAAMSLLGNLKRREKEWMLPQAFMLSKGPANGAGASRSTPKADTARPEANNTIKLNAKAPEFKPHVSVNVNGSNKSIITSLDKAEIEDGEVNSPGLPPKHESQVNSTSVARKDQQDGSRQARSEQAAEKPSTIGTGNKSGKTEGSGASSAVPTNSVAASTSSKQAENSSRVDTKPPNLPPVPPKPAVNGRPLHTLPSRPEAVPASSRSNERRDGPAERSYFTDSRDNRFPEPRRDQRRPEHFREQVHQSNSRYDQERPPHAYPAERTLNGQAPDGRYGGSTHRDARVPSLDERPDRHGRGRGPPDHDNNRKIENSGRQSRESSMPPPRVTDSSRMDRNTSNLAQQDQDRGHTVHPDRRNDLLRSESNHASSQRGSRTGSPAHREERPSRMDHARDDRSQIENRRNPDEVAHPKSRFEDNRMANGPRNDRLHEGSMNQHDGQRTNHGPSAPNHALASETGRNRHTLENDRLQHESRFGRLNPDPPSGPPSGPRSNGAPPVPSRPSRISTSTVQNVNAPNPSPQHPGSSTSLPDNRAPTGPASGRHQPRLSGPYNRQNPPSGSGPPTPSSETPNTPTVHPDRLKAIQGTETTTTASTRISNAPAAAPSGPRAPNNSQPPSPIIPRGNTGPQQFQPNERSLRSDKRFAGLNNILQQPSAQPAPERASPGASIRGRSIRATNNAGPNLPSNNGPVRSDHHGVSEDAPPSRDTQPPARQDLFANRNASGPPTSHREDERLRGADNDRRNLRRRGSTSPRRHSGPPSQAPQNSRDDGRQGQRSDELPRRGEETRDLRSRNGPPPLVNERDNRRGPRDEGVGGRGGRHSDRERRDAAGEQDWGGGDRMAPDTRLRDRRDGGQDRGGLNQSMVQSQSMGRGGSGMERRDQGGPPTRMDRRDQGGGPPSNIDRRDQGVGPPPGMDRRDQGGPGSFDAGSMNRKRTRPPMEDSYDMGKRSRR